MTLTLSNLPSLEKLIILSSKIHFLKGVESPLKLEKLCLSGMEEYFKKDEVI